MPPDFISQVILCQCVFLIDFSQKVVYNDGVNQTSRCSAVGSAPALGAGCREFESRHLDHSVIDRPCGNLWLILFIWQYSHCGILRTKQTACFGQKYSALPVADTAEHFGCSGRKNEDQHKSDGFFGHRKPAVKPKMPLIKLSATRAANGRPYILKESPAQGGSLCIFWCRVVCLPERIL